MSDQRSARHPFEKEANKLIRRLQKECARQDFTVALLAVTTVMDSIMEQVPDDVVRFSLMVVLIQSMLSRPSFDKIRPDVSSGQLENPAEMSDNEGLTTLMLAKIKGLAELCVRQWAQNRSRLDLTALRHHYRIEAVRAVPLAKLGQQFDDSDLQRLFDIFITLTTDMTDSIEDTDRRNRFALAVIARLFPPVPHSSNDPDMVEGFLNLIKSTPEPGETALHAAISNRAT